ncbi:MAG: hypothetical protein WCB75_20005 [Pseudolabrys sp.]
MTAEGAAPEILKTLNVRNPEAQERIQTAFKRGFQTRDAEMNLARLLGELGNR